MSGHKPFVVTKFGKPYIWTYDESGKAIMVPLTQAGPRDVPDIPTLPGGIGPLPAGVRELDVDLGE